MLLMFLESFLSHYYSPRLGLNNLVYWKASMLLSTLPQVYQIHNGKNHPGRIFHSSSENFTRSSQMLPNQIKTHTLKHQGPSPRIDLGQILRMQNAFLGIWELRGSWIRTFISDNGYIINEHSQVACLPLRSQRNHFELTWLPVVTDNLGMGSRPFSTNKE